MTRKNTPKPLSQENIHQRATQEAQQQTGLRARHVKVANVLREPGKVLKTNKFSQIYNAKKAELEQFNLNLGKKLTEFGTKEEVKSLIGGIRTSIQKGKAAAAAGGARRGGANNQNKENNSDEVVIVLSLLAAQFLDAILMIISGVVNILMGLFNMGGGNNVDSYKKRNGGNRKTRRNRRN